jgi:aminoglycoside phosphotransferase (APT) family kinase protein
VDVEQPLGGGNMNDVVRIGDTVRRTTGPQSASVHRLLDHVRGQGVSWVPHVHGLDDAGREVLDFIPGEVVHDLPAWLFDERVLVRIGQALREWHDATESFEHRPDDVWWQADLEPAEVICHVDFAPYNHVYRDREFVGCIDFDLCTPGPRLWDLAYTAYRYVPLTPHVDDAVADGDSWGRSELPHSEQRRRLDAFLAAYGPVASADAGEAPYSASAVLAYLPDRLFAMADWCDTQESPDLQRNGVMYRAHGEWIAAGGLDR